MIATEVDYWFTPHAARKMGERGFTRSDVLDCLRNYEQSYGALHDGYRVCQKGVLAVVVCDERQEIITVLRRQQEAWGEQEKITVV